MSFSLICLRTPLGRCLCWPQGNRFFVITIQHTSFRRQNSHHLPEPRGAFILVQSDAKPSGCEGFTFTSYCSKSVPGGQETVMLSMALQSSVQYNALLCTVSPGLGIFHSNMLSISRGSSNTYISGCLTFPTASPSFQFLLTSQAAILHCDVFRANEMPWNKYSGRFLLKSVQWIETEASKKRRFASHCVSLRSSHSPLTLVRLGIWWLIRLESGSSAVWVPQLFPIRLMVQTFIALLPFFGCSPHGCMPCPHHILPGSPLRCPEPQGEANEGMKLIGASSGLQENHRTTEWPGLKKTTMLIPFQPPAVFRVSNQQTRQPRATSSLQREERGETPMGAASL